MVWNEVQKTRAHHCLESTTADAYYDEYCLGKEERAKEAHWRLFAGPECSPSYHERQY